LETSTHLFPKDWKTVRSLLQALEKTSGIFPGLGTRGMGCAILHAMKWLGVMVLVLAAGVAGAQTPGAPRYDIGTPALTWLWVNPTSGNDAASGTSNAPLRTLTEAWNRIPANTTLTGHGYGIALLPGDYSTAAVPGWMEARWGTAATPVLVQAIGGRGTARLHGYLDIFNCRYLYFVDISIVTDSGYGGGGNVLHLANCDHVLLRGCTLNGFDGTTRQPQETLKANQTQHLYVEECDISGAFWYPLDYVAVQYGHLVASKIHNAGEWCVLVKGGSAHLLVEGNEIYDGATGGFVAGNGTGFEFMTSPWIHYEVEHIKFVNNLIHHTGTAGMGVNGGYNVLLAYNTLYKAGTNDHAIEVVHGARSCDGNAARCATLNATGGWGNATANGQFIPARNVYIYNNLVYNPVGSGSRWSHFTVAGPVTPPAGCNVTDPAVVDANLRIAGNLIWNYGTPALGLGDTGEGGQYTNPTCNITLVLGNNIINNIEPPLVDPEHGDYRVRAGESLGISLADIPPFPGDDRASPPLAPQGNLTNTVALINFPFSSNLVIASTLGTALNQPAWNWTTGGDANWFSQSAVTRDGTAAQSGALAAGQQSWMQATTNGPGSLLFWWRASSAATNQLQFYLGTQLVSQISGNVGWNQYVTFIGSTNEVTLKWVYAKNSGAISGSDAGFVDQVTWLPCAYATNVPQLFFQEPSGMVASWVVGSTGSFLFARILANTGGWALKTAGDIDGDGVSDLLFQDTASNTGGWFLNADGSTRDARFWWNVGGWEIKAAGDYETLGRAQLFFQTAGGNTAYWRLDTNGAFLAAVPLGNMGGWRLRGAGDLDGDHKAELFWQNAAGQVAIWWHDGPGGTIRGALAFSTGEWALSGVTDVDNDGVCDLLWQTPDTRTGGWFMNSNNTVRSASFWWPTGGWTLKAAGR
jgi:hypothetical protein